MRPFISHIRFPLMSINYLLQTILPLKDKIFVHQDDFLYIMIYKINLTVNISASKGQQEYKFDLRHLCCSYEPRIYDNNDDKHGQESSISLDEQLMRLSAENKLLKHKNNELKEKNHKLKAKIQKEKEKRKQSTASVTSPKQSENTRRKNTRSATNMFTTGLYMLYIYITYNTYNI